MTDQKHNFFCAEIPDNTAGTVSLSSDESHHAARVLRVEPGDIVGLLDGRGTVASARIENVGGSGRRSQVALRIIERRTVPAPATRLHLYVAPPRTKKMVQIIRQATELGIYRIVPIICQGSVSKPGADSPKERWLQEAVAALKQSGNPFMPGIEAPVDFAGAVKDAPRPGVFGEIGVVAPGMTQETLPVADCAVWVGPEAGFTTAEVDALKEAGFTPVSAGPWILRVETAVPAIVGWLRGRGMVS